jgi:hypothetical protein
MEARGIGRGNFRAAPTPRTIAGAGARLTDRVATHQLGVGVSPSARLPRNASRGDGPAPLHELRGGHRPSLAGTVRRVRPGGNGGGAWIRARGGLMMFDPRKKAPHGCVRQPARYAHPSFLSSEKSVTQGPRRHSCGRVVLPSTSARRHRPGDRRSTVFRHFSRFQARSFW